MNFSNELVRLQKFSFDKDNLWFSFSDGRMLSVPKVFFTRLSNATDEELNNYTISGGGIGIHWDSLDEDIYAPNLLQCEKLNVSYA